MTPDEQLALWVEGESFHNGDPKDPQSECCPDFSCCKPELLQPVEVRRAFVAASDRERHKFLMAFLQAAVAKLPAKVHVAGSDPNPS
jgi:hypothetical protein